MSLRIGAKCDINKIFELKRIGFDCIELYISEHDLQRVEFPWIDRVVVSAIHVPNFVTYRGRREYTNIVNYGPIGKLSFEITKRTIELCKRLSSSKVILHPGYFDIFTSDFQKTLSKLRDKISQLDLCNVIICLENMPLWTRTMHIHEPIIFDNDHMMVVKKVMNGLVKFTLDIEHLVVSGIVKHFYQEFKNDYYLTNHDLSRNTAFNELDKKIRKRLIEFTQNDPSGIKEMVDNLLVTTIRKFKDDIIHIHVCGTDYLNYGELSQDRGVYQGEHLPLFYVGDSDGLTVKDRIPHKTWVMACKDIPHNVDIIIEVNCGKSFNCYEQLKNNRLKLQQLIKEIFYRLR